MEVDSGTLLLFIALMDFQNDVVSLDDNEFAKASARTTSSFRLHCRRAYLNGARVVFM